MKFIMPQTAKMYMNIVYHRILKVHSTSCVIEACSCVATVPTFLICCKARLVTKDFNFVCLHITYITIDVTTNGIIAVTNRKMSIVYLLKKEFLLAKSKPLLLLCLSCKSKISFLC